MLNQLNNLMMDIELRSGNPHAKANIQQMIVGVIYLLNNGQPESELSEVVKSIYGRISEL